MPKKLILFFLVLFSIGFVESKAQVFNTGSTKAKFKTLFIYNFAKYTEWPEGAIGDDFVVGVLNDSLLFEALYAAAKTKKINKNDVAVRFYTNLDYASDCQVFYANSESGYIASDLFKAIGVSPVLLVTDAYPFSSTMLNFAKANGRINFEMNEANIKSQGLKISASLGRLASNISKEGNKGQITSEAEWMALLNQTKKVLAEEKKKTSELEEDNTQLSDEVVTLTTDLKTLRAQRKALQANIVNQGAELEEIFGRIGLQRDVYQKLTKELETKNSEIESKEQGLLIAENRLNDQLAQLEETTNANVTMEKKMNLNARLLDNQKTLNLIVILIALIIAVLGIIAFRNYKLQQKQSAVISEQKREVESSRDEISLQHNQLEEKNGEILDSINYAKRIQTAILPPSKLVKKYLAQSFILYKPKDVVAGDFYWMETVGDVVYFAAADCTGHGVPGAMVSVICNNGLNRAVREFGLRTPAEILDKTRELVIQEFEKSEEEVKDGMDISLCALNTKTNDLEWAGANNPLCIVASNKGQVARSFPEQASASSLESSTSLFEIKANKQPIGKYGLESPFTNHSIQLEKGDTIYIYTDGYPDQFGGDKGKKYKSGNFKITLVRLSQESIEKQKEMLDQEFESWRGTLEQIDDVCVIGVKV